jgi:hypothetical protein
MDANGRKLAFLCRSNYYFFHKAPRLYSRVWVDSIPDPLLLRKSGSTRNRTRNLWICSQELWPLDHRGGVSGMQCHSNPWLQQETFSNRCITDICYWGNSEERNAQHSFWVRYLPISWCQTSLLSAVTWYPIHENKMISCKSYGPHRTSCMFHKFLCSTLQCTVFVINKCLICNYLICIIEYCYVNA